MKYKHHSRHHIIPKSRGGNSSLENIAIVNSKKHQLYHNLFSNRRPEEIID
jgi:5-methylcytosine-specific restriction endonuclease McrA